MGIRIESIKMKDTYIIINYVLVNVKHIFKCYKKKLKKT